MKFLLVRCPMSCEWNGELRSLEDHIQKVCENAIVPCPNSCSNGKTKMMRKNIDFHILTKCPNRLHSCPKCQNVMELRNAVSHELNECPKRRYTCPHCNEGGVYDERTTTHLEVCSKVEIKCKKCSQNFRCYNKSVHPLDCPDEPVRCTYYNIGCEEKPLRKDLGTHEENAQLHLSLATKEVLRLKNKILVKNTLTFKMKLQVHPMVYEEFYSPPFHTSAAGYKLCICVYANGLDVRGTHVSVSAHLMKGDNDDSLSWPFTGTVTIELLNQLEDKNHHKKTVTFTADYEVNEIVVDGERSLNGSGWPHFTSHADLAHEPLTNRQYLKDDTLIFRVSAEAPDYKPWLECN